MRKGKLEECGGPETKRRIFQHLVMLNAAVRWIRKEQIVSTVLGNMEVLGHTGSGRYDRSCSWAQSGWRGDCKGEIRMAI